MDFAMVPPEVNSGRMYSGPGAGPMLAAATAWDALASELHTVGAGYESMIAELSGGWIGPSAAAMAAAATPYATWMHATAMQAEQTAVQAKAAVAAYEAAFAMTVPPPVIAANRAQLMTLLATNFFGQNTAAIAATEAHYGQMWAQDATAMYGYAPSAAAASTLQPFTAPPQTTNPAGSAAPMGPPAFLGALTPTLSPNPALSSAYLALAITLFANFGVDSVGTFGVDAIGTFVIDAAGAAIGAWEAGLLPLAGLVSSSSPALAGMGQAASIGALSVPAGWAAAAPSAVAALTASSAAAAPAAAARLSAIPLAPMATAGMAGRAMAGADRGQRAQTTTQQLPDAPKRPSRRGRISGIADDLRELARLRDSGYFTEEKFTEQKRRLLSQ